MEKLQEGIKELMDSGLSLSTIVKMCKDIYRKMYKDVYINKQHEEISYHVATYSEGDNTRDE